MIKKGDVVIINMPYEPVNNPGMYHNEQGVVIGIETDTDPKSLYYDKPYHIQLDKKFGDYLHFSKKNII